MGILSNIFGKDSKDDGETTLVCESCGDEYDDDGTGIDLCPACVEVSDSPKYCCGQMYDSDTLTCASCGDPI